MDGVSRQELSRVADGGGGRVRRYFRVEGREEIFSGGGERGSRRYGGDVVSCVHISCVII